MRVWKGAAVHLQVGTLEPVALSLPSGTKDKLKVVQSINTPVIAPIGQGQVLGEAQIQLDGKTLKTVPLVALQPVAKGGLWTRLIDTIRLWLHWT